MFGSEEENILKIVLTNAWSYYNKGDAAIVVSMLRALTTSYSNSQFSFLAFDPESFKKAQKKGEIPRTVRILPEICTTRTVKILLSKDHAGIFTLFLLVFLPLILKILRRIDSTLDLTLKHLETSDIIISCGGNQLYSIVGFSFLRHLYPLIWGKLICKKPLMIFAQSIGPIRGYLNSIIVKFILDRSDCITLRENYSEKYLRKNLKIKCRNLFTTADATFMLQTEQRSIGSKNRIKSNLVGITIRPWFLIHNKSYWRYVSTIADFIEYLQKIYHAEVILIAFSQIPGFEDDLQACNDVYNAVKNKKNLAIIEMRDFSLKEVNKVMLDLNYLVGTRMHSVIFASILGVPSVVISYQYHKSAGITKMLDLMPPLDIDHLTLNQLVTNYEKIMRNPRLNELNENVHKLVLRSKMNMVIFKKLVTQTEL